MCRFPSARLSETLVVTTARCCYGLKVIPAAPVHIYPVRRSNRSVCVHKIEGSSPGWACAEAAAGEHQAGLCTSLTNCCISITGVCKSVVKHRHRVTCRFPGGKNVIFLLETGLLLSETAFGFKPAPQIKTGVFSACCFQPSTQDIAFKDLLAVLMFFISSSLKIKESAGWLSAAMKRAAARGRAAFG